MKRHERLNNERLERAVRDYLACTSSCRQSTRRNVRRFYNERPDVAADLVAHFDATHPGLNYAPARMLTRPLVKIRIVLEDALETSGGLRRGRSWARRRTLLLAFSVLVVTLPMILSPTHPIAVYGYLADRYNSRWTPKAFAHTHVDLPEFLISPEQVEGYRNDLLDDMLDTRSGRLFAITRSPDGTLTQKPIRTWNGFITIPLPRIIERWLDRKELPFLGDQVELWLQGHQIIAMGHYHAFGGGPSRGDKTAQSLTELPEVVVSNGVVPMVYLGGKLIPYGGDIIVSEEILRHLRTLEGSLTMDVLGTRLIATEPSQALMSFLAYLKEYRDADISRLESVAAEAHELCLNFKEQYGSAFENGFTLAPYDDDPDRTNLLRNIASLQAWGDIYELDPEDAASAPIPGDAPDFTVLHTGDLNAK